MERYGGEGLRADVLKAGHHGSRTASSQELLEAVRPALAVISCGRRNKYGHPAPETLARFRADGVPVARTLVLAYVVCGVLAAAAGVMLASRATIGSPTAGQGLELSAIAVVVIGGSSLLGGRGTLLGTMGGVVLLALIDTSFTLLQIDATLNDLIRGIVILAAAAIFVTRSDR